MCLLNMRLGGHESSCNVPKRYRFVIKHYGKGAGSY